MIICFPGKISRGKQDWPYSKITTSGAKLLEGGVHQQKQKLPVNMPLCTGPALARNGIFTGLRRHLTDYKYYIKHNNKHTYTHTITRRPENDMNQRQPPVCNGMLSPNDLR